MENSLLALLGFTNANSGLVANSGHWQSFPGSARATSFADLLAQLEGKIPQVEAEQIHEAQSQSEVFEPMLSQKEELSLKGDAQQNIEQPNNEDDPVLVESNSSSSALTSSEQTVQIAPEVPISEPETDTETEAETEVAGEAQLDVQVADTEAVAEVEKPDPNHERPDQVQWNSTMEVNPAEHSAKAAVEQMNQPFQEHNPDRAHATNPVSNGHQAVQAFEKNLHLSEQPKPEAVPETIENQEKPEKSEMPVKLDAQVKPEMQDQSETTAKQVMQEKSETPDQPDLHEHHKTQEKPEMHEHQKTQQKPAMQHTPFASQQREMADSLETALHTSRETRPVKPDKGVAGESSNIEVELQEATGEIRQQPLRSTKSTRIVSQQPQMVIKEQNAASDGDPNLSQDQESAPERVFMSRRGDLVVLEGGQSKAAAKAPNLLEEPDSKEILTVGRQQVVIHDPPRDLPNQARPAEVVTGRFPEILEDQIAKFSTSTVNGETKVIRIKLAPAELGEIRVELQMHEGKVLGQIQTSQTDTRDLIMSNINQLRVALESQGIQVSNLAVSQSNISQFAWEGFADRRPQFASGKKDNRKGASENNREIGISRRQQLRAGVGMLAGNASLDLKM